MKEGLIFIISGPSGGGKTSLTKRVMSDLGDLRFSVSCTTRKPREGEVDGKDYTFVSKDEFNNMVQEGLFVEYANVYGNLYGTPVSEFEKAKKKGIDLILDIDVQGARQIKERFGSCIFCFVSPSSIDELKKRLTLRGTDGDAQIQRRVSEARKEMKEAGFNEIKTDSVVCQEMEQACLYDYIIINDDLERAVDALREIIERKRKELTSS